MKPQDVLLITGVQKINLPAQTKERNDHEKNLLKFLTKPFPPLIFDNLFKTTNQK